jgi:hypothetical protein
VWLRRATLMAAAADHVPVAGSKISALFSAAPAVTSPPVTSTFPLPSTVAVWALRAADISPVAFHVPVAGSKISADRIGE